MDRKQLENKQEVEEYIANLVKRVEKADAYFLTSEYDELPVFKKDNLLDIYKDITRSIAKFQRLLDLFF